MAALRNQDFSTKHSNRHSRSEGSRSNEKLGDSSEPNVEKTKRKKKKREKEEREMANSRRLEEWETLGFESESLFH